MAIYAHVKIIHNQTPHLHGIIRGRLAYALDEIAVKIRDTAKELVPVRTGALQGSIHVEIMKGLGDQHSDLQLGVMAEMFYAPFVEYGTRFMAARPYMTPAVEMHREELVRMAQVALRSIESDVQARANRYGKWQEL